jgi:hypothetical protein
MNQDFLTRLMQARTPEERDWLLTESLLETLSSELRSLTLAAVVPHWFDPEILAVLQPELADRSEPLYEEIQQISFIEQFPERGHNVHEATRSRILKHLWQNQRENYQAISSRLADFFSEEDSAHYNQAEWIYHLAIANPTAASDALKEAMTLLIRDYRRSEAEAVLRGLGEHLADGRIEATLAIQIIYWEGKV